MELLAQERDRLLRSTTRVVGIVCALVSVVAVATSLAVPALPLVVGFTCIAVMIGALVAFGWNGSTWWTALTVLSGLGAVAVLATAVAPR
ncbi:hypothetical protein [Curtobacterium sp. MCJR17_043]|uniref:hypothetical protein n=1 Tax=Curtobacterium sp. MCJR17_043 TaxID=2175660 RepID=UPI0024DFDE44|nr:hypothetical protein [Curtobacterium sp. MCJR17_043]WIB35158.1 hypothetical protein DEJ15_12210 [Curtobacterium sp. MCJR17_043]